MLEKEFGTKWLELLNNIKIFSIGPQTSNVCNEILGRVDKEATKYSFEGLLDIQKIIDELMLAENTSKLKELGETI